MSTRDHDNKAARAQMFAKLQRALKDGPAQSARRTHVEGRVAAPPNHPLPERVRRSRNELRMQFKAFLEGQSASVLEVAGAGDVPAAIANWLRGHNLPLTVRMGDDAALAELPWSREPALLRENGPAKESDTTGLSHAFAGIAETGTLALTSGPDNPVTLNFVPENHVIVLADADLVGPYEEVWTRLRQRFGKGQMPRTVNFISGPSRTADIGGKLVTGAHGPRRLCVVLVSEPMT